MLKSIAQEEFEKTFLKWIERPKLCVSHKGVFREYSVILYHLNKYFRVIWPGRYGADSNKYKFIES